MNNIIQHSVRVTKANEYFSKHLEIISPFLPAHLTKKEVEVLGMFMSFDESGILKRFDTPYRKIVRDTIGLSHSGLSGHISNLIAKAAITEELNGDLTIKSYLFPEETKQFYQFKILLKDDTN
jgi:hypothetical protein